MTDRTAKGPAGVGASVILRRRVQFDTDGIATGVKIGTLPAKAFIKSIMVDVHTAFNAGSTNVLTVGGEGDSGYDDIVASGDIDETSATAQNGAVAKMGVYNDSADKDVFVAFTQTGTAATTGDATVLIEAHCYEGR